MKRLLYMIGYFCYIGGIMVAICTATRDFLSCNFLGVILKSIYCAVVIWVLVNKTTYFKGKK